MNNITYKSAWKELESKFPFPRKARKIQTVDYKEFKEKVIISDPRFILDVTESLFGGDLYILKGAYTKEFMENLKINTFSHCEKKDKNPEHFCTQRELAENLHMSLKHVGPGLVKLVDQGLVRKESYNLRGKEAMKFIPLGNQTKIIKPNTIISNTVS